MINFRFFILFLVFFITIYIANGQNFLQITDLNTRKITTIKSGNFIQCYYRLNETKNIFFYGEVGQVLDSTISFRRGGVIPYAHINNIDRPTIKRGILPAIFMGLVAGGIGIFTQSRQSSSANELVLLGATSVTVAYTLLWNRRKLKKNIVDERVSLQVIKPFP